MNVGKIDVEANDSLGSTQGVLFLAVLNTQQYSLKF
jgi:hypothetical protein